MRLKGYLTIKQYKILSEETESLVGWGHNAKRVPDVLQKLAEDGFINDVKRVGQLWVWNVTDRGRSEAAISLQEANRRERKMERERGL